MEIREFVQKIENLYWRRFVVTSFDSSRPTRAYVLESQFSHAGCRCVVLSNDHGERCGYVGLPEGHHLYGSNVPGLSVHGTKVELVEESSDSLKYIYDVRVSPWWFGFAYGPAEGHLVPKRCRKCFGHIPDALAGVPSAEDHPIPINYVEWECRRLAEQLSFV